VHNVPRKAGLVQRVKVQMVCAFFQQIGAKLGADGGGQKIAAPVAFSGFEHCGKRGRDACATPLGEPPGAAPVFDGQDAGDDLGGDASFGASIAESEERFGLKEELSNGVCRTCVDFAFQPVDVGVCVRGFGVPVGVGTDGDLELAGFGEGRDQFGRVFEPVGMSAKGLRAFWWITAQGDDALDAGLGVTLCNLKRFFTGGINACEVCRNVQTHVSAKRLDGFVGQFAGRAAGSVSDRNERRVEMCKRADRVPKPERGFEGLGWKKLE